MLASPIGHYQSGTSLIHKLDARVKLVITVVLVIATVCVSTPAQLIWALLGLAGLIYLAKLPRRSVWTSVAPIVPFAAVVALFNLCVVQGGSTLVQLGVLTISQGGIWAAILYTARLLIAVSLGALLLLTTTPTSLTDAFEKLLMPLGRFGVPAHEIAMVLSLALRFVPILADETQSVIDAQAARGGSIEDGTLSERFNALGAVLVAVFAGAMRHAQNLSRALDARCYEDGAKRTHYRELCITSNDLCFMGLCILWLLVLVVLGIVL